MICTYIYIYIYPGPGYTPNEHDSLKPLGFRDFFLTNSYPSLQI